jgi:hypothetical protein
MNECLDSRWREEGPRAAPSIAQVHPQHVVAFVARLAFIGRGGTVPSLLGSLDIKRLREARRLCPGRGCGTPSAALAHPRHASGGQALVSTGGPRAALPIAQTYPQHVVALSPTAARGWRRPLRWRQPAALDSASLLSGQEPPRVAPSLLPQAAAVAASGAASRRSMGCPCARLAARSSRGQCLKVAADMSRAFSGATTQRDCAKRLPLRWSTSSLWSRCARRGGYSLLRGSALTLERRPKSNNVGTTNLLK